jgi:hypothetical protein
MIVHVCIVKQLASMLDFINPSSDFVTHCVPLVIFVSISYHLLLMTNGMYHVTITSMAVTREYTVSEQNKEKKEHF